VAVDGNLVPFLGVAFVIDRYIVVLAPEKWHRLERFTLAQHVASGGLSLALRHHPMLNPDVFAGVRIGPARDVACSVDSRDARFQISARGDAPIERKAGLFGQRQAWTHANTNDD